MVLCGSVDVDNILASIASVMMAQSNCLLDFIEAESKTQVENTESSLSSWAFASYCKYFTWNW